MKKCRGTIFGSVLIVLLLLVSTCGRAEPADGTGVFIPYDFTWATEQFAPEPWNIIARIGDDIIVPIHIAAGMLDILELEHSLPASGHMTVRHVNEAIAAGLVAEDDETPISYALWVDLLTAYMYENDIQDTVARANVVILDSCELYAYTSHGAFLHGGMNLSRFADMEVRILHRGDALVAAVGITHQRPTVHNARILAQNERTITLFAGGATRQFTRAEGVNLPHGTAIATVQVHRGQILAATPAQGIVRGEILRVNETAREIELYNHGALPLCQNFKVYGYNYDAHSLEPTIRLLVGSDMADFHVLDGRIAAAIITHQPQPREIRVALHTTGFASLRHDEVRITSDGAFTVRSGVDSTTHPAGYVLTIRGAQQRQYIAPADPENHKLQIVSIQRGQAEAPMYRGTLEVAPFPGGGGFTVINIVCIEQYLYAVIPSEMPAGHGVVAAQVQAVTARGFAHRQLYEQRLRHLGAHVCDSVMSQVYNNLAETDIARDAVRATRGEVLMHDGAVAMTNYFSTSAGFTANSGEVWADGINFPAHTPPYLRAQAQFDTRDAPRVGDLRREYYAANFFKNWDFPAFDTPFAWFRWRVTMPLADISIPAVGTVEALEVTMRGEGGNAMQIRVTGCTHTIYIDTELAIRQAISPRAATIYRHDGTHVTGMGMLPSGFFVIEKHAASASVTFHGGGHGHGVGMSQNAVRSLAEMGLDYAQILRHFYPGTQLIRLW